MKQNIIYHLIMMILVSISTIFFFTLFLKGINAAISIGAQSFLLFSIVIMLILVRIHYLKLIKEIEIFKQSKQTQHGPFRKKKQKQSN